MNLSALLVCNDDAANAVLRRVLEELKIQVESCPDFARATMRASQQRFDLIIVDWKSNAEVLSLLRETRLSRMNDNTLAVAVVPSQESIRELFSLGVNFVLYKPVAYERALTSLRAARALMRKDKRKAPRAPVHTHAVVDYANVAEEKATLIDLSKDGLAVLFGKKLPPTSKIYFQFRLPGQKSSVRLSGHMIWQDWNYRSGVQFADVPTPSRKLIDEYLAANTPAESQKQLSEVAVEIDEIAAPLGPVVIPEQIFEEAPRKAQAPSDHRVAEPLFEKITYHGEDAPLGLIDHGSDPDNRRRKERYGCRIGAEVYQTGKNVPNRCCISDLSAGGCYVELSLPFPSGSSVEIIIRTYEMKINMRGVVQASHPGYGMGVAFELKTAEEQENAKKLMEFVATAKAQ